jgi:hypothetical protein
LLLYCPGFLGGMRSNQPTLSSSLVVESNPSSMTLADFLTIRHLWKGSKDLKDLSFQINWQIMEIWNIHIDKDTKSLIWRGFLTANNGAEEKQLHQKGGIRESISRSRPVALKVGWLGPVELSSLTEGAFPHRLSLDGGTPLTRHEFSAQHPWLYPPMISRSPFPIIPATGLLVVLVTKLHKQWRTDVFLDDTKVYGSPKTFYWLIDVAACFHFWDIFSEVSSLGIQYL